MRLFEVELVIDEIGRTRSLGLFTGTYAQIAEAILFDNPDLNARYLVREHKLTDVTHYKLEVVRYCTLQDGFLNFTLNGDEGFKILRERRLRQSIKEKLTPEEYELIKGAL